MYKMIRSLVSTQYKIILSGLIVTLTTITSVLANEQQLTSQQLMAAHQPISLKGEELVEFLGQSLTSLSLAAMSQEDNLVPIPFQWEELNKNGMIFFSKHKVPLSGTEEVLDPQDRLVFLLRDAGKKMNQVPKIDGTVVAEVKVELGQKVAYVYLLENSKLRSQNTYVRYSKSMGLVETGHYALSVSPENAFHWQRLMIREGQLQYESAIKALRLWYQSGLVMPALRVKLNNKNHFTATPVANQIGPVRVVTHFDVWVKVLKVPIFKIDLQLYHQPRSLLYDVRIKIPPVRRRTLVRPQLTIGWQGQDLMSGEIFFAGSNPTTLEEQSNVTKQVKNSAAEPLQLDFNSGLNWFWMYPKRKQEWLVFFNIKNPDQANLPVSYWKDPLLLNQETAEDRVQDAEKINLIPDLGFLIENFPLSGTVNFLIEMYMGVDMVTDEMVGLSEDVFKAKLQQRVQSSLQQPKITVMKLKLN